jgi:hypothetical protein
MHHPSPGLSTISSSAPWASVPCITESKQNSIAAGSTPESAPARLFHLGELSFRRILDDIQHALHERHFMHERTSVNMIEYCFRS